MMHSGTLDLACSIVQKHQLCGYRWPGLLSQMAFADPVGLRCVGALQVLLAHCMGSTNQNWLCARATANGHLDLSCGLCTFLSPTGNIAPLSVAE